MKIDIQNDTKNNKMIVSVSVAAATRSRDPVETFMWKDVEALLKDYTPPDGYEVGKCHRRSQKVDNRHPDKLHKQWVFDLVKKKPAVKKNKVAFKNKKSEV